MYLYFPITNSSLITLVNFTNCVWRVWAYNIVALERRGAACTWCVQEDCLRQTTPIFASYPPPPPSSTSTPLPPTLIMQNIFFFKSTLISCLFVHYMETFLIKNTVKLNSYLILHPFFHNINRKEFLHTLKLSIYFSNILEIERENA